MSDQLSDLIRNSSNIVAFTGAGISTESGIPDFRSSGGLYTTGEFEGMSPETILSRRTLRINPKLVIRFYKKRLLGMIDKEPNRAHLALVKLEEVGKLKAVITQNIDNLHRKAGSKAMYELHGNSTKFYCTLGCPRQYNYEEFKLISAETDQPLCCMCGTGLIRPKVVLFDESLDDLVFDAAEVAMTKADLVLAIGSSLSVMPACGLLASRSKTSKLVIINSTETPYDKKADLVIRESCGQVLEDVIKGL